MPDLDPKKPTTDTTHTERKVVEPTEAEKRNGWDTDSLSKYVSERESAQAENVFPPPVRPFTQNHRYNPHRWR